MKKLTVIFAVISAVSLFIAGFSVYGLLFRRQPTAVVSPDDPAPHITLTVETLYELIAPCTDLVSAYDQYTNRASLSDHCELFGYTVPFTTEEVEFSYIGTLRTGIDLSQVTFLKKTQLAFYIYSLNPKWLYSEHIHSYSYPHGKGTLSCTEDQALLHSAVSRESAP